MRSDEIRKLPVNGHDIAESGEQQYVLNTMGAGRDQSTAGIANVLMRELAAQIAELNEKGNRIHDLEGQPAMKPPRITVRVEVEHDDGSKSYRQSEIAATHSPRDQELIYSQAVREMLRQLGR